MEVLEKYSQNIHQLKYLRLPSQIGFRLDTMEQQEALKENQTDAERVLFVT
jgi:hypothetical protein